MFFTVKDYEDIEQDSVVSSYIRKQADADVSNKIMKGLYNIDLIEADDTFKAIDVYEYVKKTEEGDKLVTMYLILENTKGVFIVSCDNAELHEEPIDVLRGYGYKHLIRSSNKTILVDADNKKFITTLQEGDTDDPEKALMICLLKAEGYNVKDIYEMVKLISM